MTKYLILASLFLSQVGLADEYRVVDQDSNDVTVLRAFVREDLRAVNLINVDDCEFKGSEINRNVEYKSFNCAWNLANAMHATPVNPNYRIRTVNGRIDQSDSDAAVVEIHTLIPLEVFEKVSEIGFSLGSLGGTIHKYAKNQTREIQKVKLKDGRVGLVHRFVMPFQANGRTSQCTIRTVTFKPFVTFYEPSTLTEYRNWDVANGRGFFTDYSITNFQASSGQCQAPNRVDRDAQLIE